MLENYDAAFDTYGRIFKVNIRRTSRPAIS